MGPEPRRPRQAGRGAPAPSRPRHPGRGWEPQSGLGGQRRPGRGYSIWPSAGRPRPSPRGRVSRPQGWLPPGSGLTLPRLPPPSPRALGAARKPLARRPPPAGRPTSPSPLTLPAPGRLTGGLSTPLGAAALSSPAGVWPRPAPRWGPDPQRQGLKPTSAPDAKAAVSKPALPERAGPGGGDADAATGATRQRFPMHVASGPRAQLHPGGVLNEYLSVWVTI